MEVWGISAAEVQGGEPKGAKDIQNSDKHRNINTVKTQGCLVGLGASWRDMSGPLLQAMLLASQFKARLSFRWVAF